MAGNNSTNYITSGPLFRAWSEHQFQLLIPSLVLIVLIIFIGIPGNVVIIWVYTKKMRHTASRIFILALAFCDLANCLLTMPMEISIIVNYWTYDNHTVCSMGHTLTYILNGTSAILLCGIAVDRFRKICRPLKPVFTPKRVKQICLVSFLLAVAFYIPGFVMYGTQTVEVQLPGRNSVLVGKICQLCDRYKDSKVSKYIIAVWFLATLTVMVVLIVTYSRIGKAVYTRLKLEKQRKGSMTMTPRPTLMLRQRATNADDNSETSCSFDDLDEEKHKHPSREGKQAKVLKTLSMPARRTLAKSLKDRFRNSVPVELLFKQRKDAIGPRRIHVGRTTIMLLAVTIAYVVSFLPFVVIVAIRVVVPAYYTTLSDAQKSIWQFFLRSYVINCAANPIMYGLFNKDFRNKMWGLLQCVPTP